MAVIIAKDSIYGQVDVDSLAAKIIETEYFKRLKNIKQLSFVYKYCQKIDKPNCGNHSRYDHCIGTYHLAGQFLDNLEKNSGIKIKEDHKLYVKIAGLLHDVGHGPFSHFWEKFNYTYEHENESKMCVELIFEKINENEDKNYNVRLITSLITGNENPSKDFPDIPEYLFEIIHNKRCNIDVDKWDYIQRDFHHCKELLKENKQDVAKIEKDVKKLTELFLNAKISKCGKHIDYRNWDDVRNLFEIRHEFHKNIYCLPEVKFFDELIKRSLDIMFEYQIKFNGESLKSIHPSDENFWKKFTDEEILSFLKKQKKSKVQKYMKCFENMSYKEISSNESNENDVVVTCMIPNILKTMPKWDCINVYDDTRNPKEVFDELKGEDFCSNYYFRIHDEE